MSKKRKEPPQSSTLLSFFASGNKKRSVDASDRLSLNTRQPGAEVQREAVNGSLGADVIVIESDDEREVDGQSDGHSRGVEAVAELSTRQRQEPKGTTQEGVFELRKKRHGNVGGLLANGVNDNSLHIEPDEWDYTMGDGELIDDLGEYNLPEDICEDLARNLEPEESQIERQAAESCPMCTMTFLDLEPLDIQMHVNNCLDNPSSVERPTATRRPLRPLPSFPTSTTNEPSKPGLKSKLTSAFSVLMSGKAASERAAWDEVQATEDRNFRPTNAERRKAPFYKVLTGMPIAVDAFRYGAIPGIEAYFLTHAHSDHYTNLSSKWKNGPIYCSETTANLVAHMLSVDRKWLHPLPMNTQVEVPMSGGVKVTSIDANHCPGSCLFLFEGPQTVNAGDSTFKSPFVGTSRVFRYLHCGDFRASPQHVLHLAVKGKHLDTVYLDTTYLNPRYCFPPQPLVISACAELSRRIVNGEPINSDGEANGSIQGWMKDGKGKQKDQVKGDVLVVVGTYSIGKERVVKAIAKTLNTRVYCDARKKAILLCQDDPDLHALLTDEPLEAGVHVVPLGAVASDRFKEYMERWKGRWTRAVAFRPTGWTYTPPAGSDPMPPISRVVSAAQSRDFSYTHLKPARNSTSQFMQYGVPYSEHSSFAELACFALSIECSKIVATVNVGSTTARAKMSKWIEKWDAERKRRKESGLPPVVEYRHLDYW